MKGLKEARGPRNHISKRRHALVVAGTLAALGLVWHATTSQSGSARLDAGYGSIGTEVEDAFLAIPDEQSALRASRLFASRPHLAGTPNDLTTAREFLKLCERELGVLRSSPEPIYPAGSPESRKATLSITQASKPRAWIDTYYPVLNTPLDRFVQILNEDDTIALDLNLAEVSDATDPDASKYANAVPPFHGLSRTGNATGGVFDGGYCTRKEFDRFSAEDVIGRIVLCKYGYVFRGLKVKAAQEAGAIGVLVYSDVNDDGTVTEKNGYAAYPRGPARNPTSVQRGSVQFISMYPGDPTTPGYPSYENSTRMEALSIPSIPSLPISWRSAQQLFQTLTTGNSLNGKRVKLVNNADSKITPIWNTMAVIPGIISDEVVILGNHRDAWVLGATDPTSGTASVHEIIRGLGYLLRQGWKPHRTILIASWDAEEYGLIGSTEWGEDFSHFISKYVVAYLNLDSAASGSRLRPASSPLLAHLVRDTAVRVPHPTAVNRTLWDARSDDGHLFGNLGVPMRPSVENISIDSDIGVNPLGSGSDYTVFLQRLGVSSTNGGFMSTLHDPVYHYHSVFDTQRWQGLYGDPGFHRHVAIARHLGLQVLRIAESAVLPFNATHYANELEKYLDRVENLAGQNSLHISFDKLRNLIASLQDASVALDSEGRLLETQWRNALEMQKEIPVTAWLSWLRCLKGLTLISRGCGQVPEKSSLGNSNKYPAQYDTKLKQISSRIRKVNMKLISFERGFISKDGIKDREWYRHLGVAPGKWLGYGATTFPALTEAITLDKNATLAKYERDRLCDLVDAITKVILAN